MRGYLGKLKTNFVSFFSQGISPHKLSLAVAFGFCIGIIPILGTSTLVCTGVALAFRLNMPLIQAVNYVAYPIQLLLFIPFLKAGTYVSGQQFNYSLSEIQFLFQNDLGNSILKLMYANVFGLLIWLILTPVLFAFIYFLFYFTLKGLEKKRSTNSIKL
jgi:uncharacterized protein (DUF2062 family)